MKRFSILLFTIFVFTSNSQSAALVDNNKVWNVVVCLNPAPCGTDVFQFGRDTMIAGQRYKLFVLNSDSGGLYNNCPLAAREDTTMKQIWFTYGIGEFLAYDFSLNVADTFHTTGITCIDPILIDSVDTVILQNGEGRKRLFLSNGGTRIDIWIEGIGSIWGLTFEAPYFYCVSDIYPELNCFKENDTLKYENGNYATCFYNTVGISKIDNPTLVEIKPNPFSDFTTVHFANPLNKETMLTIYNVSGKEIRRYPKTTDREFRIEKGNMISGVYFLEFKSEQETFSRGKLIVN